MGFVKGVVVVGGFLFFFVIVLVVVVVYVKKCFKGVLVDCNRVYVMEWLSKYVKEEKVNDGFVKDDDVNGLGE